MTEELRLAGRRDIDWTLLAPLLAHIAVTHVAVMVVRVTVSYRSIELGLPPLWRLVEFAQVRVGGIQENDRACEGSLQGVFFVTVNGTRGIVGPLALRPTGSWHRPHTRLDSGT